MFLEHIYCKLFEFRFRSLLIKKFANKKLYRKMDSYKGQEKYQFQNVASQMLKESAQILN